MNGSGLILPLLAPLLFWAAYHYYHDRHRPEPLGNLILCILLGVGSAYLSRGFYLGLGEIGLRYDAVALAGQNLAGLLAYAILGIGLTEELAKLLPFLLVVTRFRAFDQAMDGIIYASFIALGYAVVENMHFLQYLETGPAIARGFAGPLVHIVFASVWGYHIGIALVARQSIGWPALRWLIAAAALHGVYDFIVLGFSSAALIVAALLIVGVWLWRLQLLRRLGGETDAARADG